MRIVSTSRRQFLHSLMIIGAFAIGISIAKSAKSDVDFAVMDCGVTGAPSASALVTCKWTVTPAPVDKQYLVAGVAGWSPRLVVMCLTAGEVDVEMTRSDGSHYYRQLKRVPTEQKSCLVESTASVRAKSLVKGNSQGTITIVP